MDSECMYVTNGVGERSDVILPTVETESHHVGTSQASTESSRPSYCELDSEEQAILQHSHQTEERAIQQHSHQIYNRKHDVSKDQWKYLKFIWVFLGTSLAFFGINISAHGWPRVIEVEIYLLPVYGILGVLFHLLYQKIREEQQLRLLGAGNNEDGAASYPYQWVLFILTMCLAFIIYVSTVLNAVLYRK